ncbi:MAG: hypothetical protein M5U12_25430 [Verrucomicrobia bacterium]|nr:hypothetical protein [Verrucomicrobiota bacterium]
MVKGCRVKLRLGKTREPGALEINTGSGGTGCDGAGSRALRDSLKQAQHKRCAGAWGTPGKADDLGGAGLPAEDRQELAATLRKGRKALKSLKNPWG